MTDRSAQRGDGIDAAAPLFDEQFRERFELLLRWRRDVRRFRRERLPDGLMSDLLAAAALAPSVGLSQPWRFVLVDDPDRRAAIRASHASCNARALAGEEGERAALYASLKLAGLDDAPVQVAAFAVPDPAQGHRLGRATMPETCRYSAVLAVHTLWLAARARGIGLGWVSILEPDLITRVLDVPEAWHLIGYLCLGYPEEHSDTPALERAGWEHRRAPGADVLRR